MWVFVCTGHLWIFCGATERLWGVYDSEFSALIPAECGFSSGVRDTDTGSPLPAWTPVVTALQWSASNEPDISTLSALY